MSYLKQILVGKVDFVMVFAAFIFIKIVFIVWLRCNCIHKTKVLESKDYKVMLRIGTKPLEDLENF